MCAEYVRGPPAEVPALQHIHKLSMCNRSQNTIHCTSFYNTESMLQKTAKMTKHKWIKVHVRGTVGDDGAVQLQEVVVHVAGRTIADQRHQHQEEEGGTVVVAIRASPFLVLPAECWETSVAPQSAAVVLPSAAAVHVGPGVPRDEAAVPAVWENEEAVAAGRDQRESETLLAACGTEFDVAEVVALVQWDTMLELAWVTGARLVWRTAVVGWQCKKLVSGLHLPLPALVGWVVSVALLGVGH